MSPEKRTINRAATRGFSIVPLLTPFQADGSLDEAAVRRLVEHVVTGGCQAVMVCGTTGEAASMTLADRVRLLQLAVEHAAGRAMVFGGIGHNCQRDAIELASAFFRDGAAAVVAHLPSYYPIGAAEIEAYFTGLADRIAAPLYLYNIPQTTNHSIPLDVVERLSRHPHIVGIKDSEPNAARQEAVARQFAGRSDFSVFCGSIAFTVQAMRAGADGFVPSAANVAPRVTRDAMDAWMRHDEAAALKAQERIAAVSATYQSGRNVPQALCASKAALEVMGLASRHMLPPLQSWTDAMVADLRDRLRAANLVS